MPSGAPTVRSGLPAVVFGAAGKNGFDAFLDSGPFSEVTPELQRTGDVSLYVGFDWCAEGCRALAPEPSLGGRDAPRQPGSVAAALSDRRAALSYERAGAGAARDRRAQFDCPPPELHRAGLYRGDRDVSLHLAHRRAADDRHDAARERSFGQDRSVERAIRSHGFGAGQSKSDVGAQARIAQSRRHQCLWHDRSRAGGVRTASARLTDAGIVGRLSASASATAARRRQRPQCRTGRARNEMSRPS